MENFVIKNKFGSINGDWLYIEFFSAGAYYYAYWEVEWDNFKISIYEDRGLENNPQLTSMVSNKTSDIESLMLEAIDTFCVLDI